MPANPADDQTKLESLAALARDGRAAEAELELHAWCRHDGPPAARALLSALLARRGDLRAAREVMGDLARRSADQIDTHEARLAISVLILAGENDEARRLGALLLQRRGDDPAVRSWLNLLDLPGLPHLEEATGLVEASGAGFDQEAELLGAELSVRPDLLPSLVYAQKQAPVPASITLLRAAVLTIVDHFERQAEHAILSQGLAELSMLLGDEADARRWAHRALQADPYNASMALLLGRLADDEAVGPTAQETLRRVSLKFPGYPDVQKAYAQRVELDRQQRERNVA